MFEQFAAVARTIGSAHRLELLELLAQTERSVEELAGLSSLTVANASQHLQQLRRSGLVEARRDGKRVLYKLADTDVVALLGALRRITERNVGAVEKVLNSYFRERDSLEPVSRKELLRRMREGLVTVVDTRPAEEFAAGHLPRALNVPLRELKRRLRELPRDQTIVAYCRGAYCVLSYEAVAELLLGQRSRVVRGLLRERGRCEERERNSGGCRGEAVERERHGSLHRGGTAMGSACLDLWRPGSAIMSKNAQGTLPCSTTSHHRAPPPSRSTLRGSPD
jgi:ArsR family transcriptional regulator